MYPRHNVNDTNTFLRRRSISFTPTIHFGYSFNRALSFRKKEEPLQPKEHVYDEVFETTFPRNPENSTPVKKPSLDLGRIKAVDEWEARSPLNQGANKIIYPRLISEEEMEASFCRKFATNSLRLKNFVQVPNKRRVSFHDYPEIIGETNSTVNEERVKNLEAIRAKMGLGPMENRDELKGFPLEKQLHPVESETKEEKDLKKKKTKISEIIKGLLPWKKHREEKKAKKMLKEEAKEREREECLKFLTPKKAEPAGRPRSEWQEKNAAVMEELKHRTVVTP